MRRGIVRLGWALALVTLTGILIAIGLGLWIWAIYETLRLVADVALAAALTGLAAFLAAGGTAWAIRNIAR